MMFAALIVHGAGAEERKEKKRYIVTFNDSVQRFNADGSESTKDCCIATWDEIFYISNQSSIAMSFERTGSNATPYQWLST